MRAVWLRQFGGPEVLVATEVPDPVAGPGQALIEVAFANITFVEPSSAPAVTPRSGCWSRLVELQALAG